MSREDSPSTSQDGSPQPVKKSKMVSFQNNGYTPLVINEVEEVSISTHSRTSIGNDGNSRSRIVNRDNGRTNIKLVGVTTNKWIGFITDNFTTMINTPWYIVGCIFVGTYLLSWVLFGGIWIFVAFVEGRYNGTCLNGVNDFSAAMLFSIETQLTIGYGNTYVTNDCLLGLFVLILQCLTGLMLDGILLGILFTKLARPRNRRKTILFSDKAVIYKDEDDVKYLEFRVGNLRKSQIAECHVRLVLYWYRHVGDSYKFEQHDLQCGYEDGTDRMVLLTPAVVQHKIDNESPLYELTLSRLPEEDLEIVVVLEGIVEATSLTLQALWSYTSQEIVVGKKLKSIVSRQHGKWVVDLQRFDEIPTS